ncbi:7473_t:CDS:2, partial [Racocetra persica]
ASNELLHSDTSNTSDEDSSDTENCNSLTSNSQTQKTTNQIHPPVRCKYCPKKYKRELATRMQKHTNICINAPESAKTIKTKANFQQINLVNNPELKTRQNVMDNYISIDRMDRNKLLDLEYKFAKAMEFFHALRPSFRIPNYAKLSGELLNKVYEDVKKE